MTVIRIKTVSSRGVEAQKLIDMYALQYAASGPAQIKVRGGETVTVEIYGQAPTSIKELLKLKQARLKKREGNLVVEIEGQDVAEIEGFYTEASVRFTDAGWEFSRDAGLQDAGGYIEAAGPEATAQSRVAPGSSHPADPGAMAANTGGDSTTPPLAWSKLFTSIGSAAALGLAAAGRGGSSGGASDEQPKNVAPVFTSPVSYTVAEQSTAVANLKATDSGVLVWSLDGSAGDNAKFELSADGALRFKTPPDFEAPGSAARSNAYSVRVKVSDSEGLSSIKTLTVNVSNVNEVPTAITLSRNLISENTSVGTGVVVGNLSVTDPDASGNSNVLTVSDTTNFKIDNGKLVFIGASPNFASKPSYSIIVTSRDANGGSALVKTQSFVINVDRVNDAPTSSNATVQASEDTPFVFNLAHFNFSDAADTPPNALKNVIITALPLAGSFKLNGSAVVVGAAISRQDIADGKLSFTPAANASGAGYAQFKFKVQDDGGTSNGGSDTSVEHTLSLNVLEVNDAPTVTRSTENLRWLSGVSNESLLDFREFFTDVEDGNSLSFIYSANDLPSGVAMAPGSSAAVLRGTPTTVGPFTFSVTARDSGGALTTVIFKGTVASGFEFNLPSTEITSLDVDGQLVLTAVSLAGVPSDVLAVSGKIRLVHTTDATRSQEVDVTDARFVTVQGNRVIVKPPFDFDFGGAYRVEVDASAFKATVAGVANTVSRAMVAADDLGFGTVGIDAATSVSTAAQGQVVSDAGVVSQGKKWIKGTGQGDWLGGTAVDFDLSGGDYVVVVKDAGTSAGRVDQGDGVQGEGFNLRLLNVGSADRIYVDDVANNKASLNDREFTQIVDDGSGGLNMIFSATDSATDSATNANYIQISSVESGSGLDLTLPESIRGLLNVSNTRLGTRVTAIERVGADAAQDFSADLGTGASFEVKVTASFRAGDKVQLVRLNADGNEVSWGAEVTLTAADVSNGHITLSQSALSDLVQGRNTIFAKVTGADGAVTKSAMLFAAQGGLEYDTTLPVPVLSVASSEDSLTPGVSEDGTLTDTETSVLIHVEGWTVGDKLQLKLDGASLGTEVVITEAMLDNNGQLYVSVNKSDLGAAGAKQITATVTDRAGNVGTTAEALALDVLAYVQLSGAITAGPVLEGNDLVVTAYDTSGNVIGQDSSVGAGTGSYSLKVLSSYRGPVLLKVSSAGAQSDYMDEGAVAARDLGGSAFFAVSVVSGSDVTANLTPLTDVAAKKLMTGQQLSAGVLPADVQAANQVVAKLLLGQEASDADITTLAVNPTVSASGGSLAGTANLYGQVLEQISRQASGGKSFADVQSELVTGVVWSKGDEVGAASLASEGAAARAQVLAKLQFNVQSEAGQNLEITLQELSAVGVTGLGSLSAARQTALLNVLKNATNLDLVGGVDKLQGQADKALATAKIQDYAAGVDGVEAPVLSDYTRAGVTGVSAANLVAVNEAIKAADVLEVEDLAEIQALAEAGATTQGGKLALLTAYAESGGTEPTVQDYALAGVAGVTAANLLAVNAQLLAKTGEEANELGELQAIVQAGQSQHEAALQVIRSYIRDDVANPAPTQTTYRDAGVGSVLTEGQVTSTNTLLRSFPLSRAESTVADLVGTITHLESVLLKISRYGSAGYTDAAATPTAEDYKFGLVDGVTAGNLAAINSAVSVVSDTASNTPALIQSVVDAYRAVLSAANGVAAQASEADAAVSLSQLTALGLTGVLDAAHARVLSAVIDAKASADVASHAQLQALADAVAAVFTGAAGGAAPSQSQLELLGFTVASDANASSSLANIQAAIAATPDNGTGVDSLAKLKRLVANDAPTGADAQLSATEDTDRVLALADFGFLDAADTPANTLSHVIITALPGAGTLKLDGADVTLNQRISKADIEANKLVFRAAPDANGNNYASVKFKLQDNGGLDNGGVDTSGEYTLNVNVVAVNDAPTGAVALAVTSVTLGGLTQADGTTASLANGVYTQVSEADVASLVFGTAFTPDGSPTRVDMSKPVYRYTDSSSAQWYLWAREGSGYHISKLNDASEWFWESSASAEFAQTPLGLVDLGNAWVMSDASAEVVVTDPSSHIFAQGTATAVDWTVGAQVRVDTSALRDADGLGVLSYQWQQSLDGSTNWSNLSGAVATSWTLPDGMLGRYVRVQVSYTDARGQVETYSSQVTQVRDTVVPRLDLQGSAAGNDYAVNVGVTGEGVPISRQVAVAESSTINKIEVGVNRSDVALSASERLTLVGLSFNLDGTDLPAPFEVSGVTWTASYNAATSTLVFTATGAGTTAGNVQAVISAMQYVNTEAPAGNRVLSLSVFDASGNKSNPASTTLTFDQAGPVVDLDTVASGTGQAITLTTAEAINAGVSLSSAPSVADDSSLTSVRIAVSGLLDGANEFLIIAGTELRADGNALPASVSDASNTWSVAYSNGVFTFTQAAGLFTPALAQEFLQAIAFKNAAAAPIDGVRLFDLTLTDQYGNTSAAVRSRVAVNLALPTAASTSPLLTFDGDGNGIRGDVFTLNFSERVEVSSVINSADWTLSGGATLGTGATIEAVNPLIIEGVQYAASFRVTGGAGRNYTTGTTFTLAAAKVLDSTGARALADVAFTMSDIVAPGQVVPPETIGGDNHINATESSVSLGYNFTSSADNQRIRFYVNGIELAGKAQTLIAGQSSATLSMSLSDWGGSGTKSVYARLEDGAGNLGAIGISKSVIVDTSAETSFTARVTTDAGDVGPSAGDVLSLNFADPVIITSLSAQFGTGATFTAVGGAPAPGTTSPFYSDSWRVVLGTSPSTSLGGGAPVQIGVRDVAGNVATVNTTLSDSLYDLPGQVSINSVTSDNVLSVSELTQTVSLGLNSAKAGDTVRLYLDGRLVGTKALVSSDSATSFDLTASDWGADGERVLTATIQRGATVVSSDFARSVYVNADGAHWSTANGANTSIWFDPDTLSLTHGSEVTSWAASTGGGVASQSAAGRRPTFGSGSVNGHNQLFFDGGGNLTATAVTGTDFLIFNDPNGITGANRAERNVAMFTAAAAQSSAFAGGSARVILNLGYFAGSGALIDARSGAFTLGTENGANSLAGTSRSATSITLGGALTNTTSSGVYFTEAFRYAAGSNTFTLLANDQKLTTTAATDVFLNTTDAATGQGNPLMIGSANYGNYFSGGGAGAWYGNVGDVIAFVTPDALTDNQMQEVQTYLAAKYRTSGVQVTRGANDQFDLSISQTSTLLIDNIIALNSSVSDDVIITAGSDYVNAGAGSDKVHIKDLAFRHIDGGTGADTLLLASDYAGSNTIVLADFASNARGNSGNAVADARVNTAGWHKLYGFEQIDLSTSAAKQTLTVSAADVNQLSETNTLGIKLGENDVLNATGFTSADAVWGYYSVGDTIFTQRYVDSTGAFTLYAIGGNSQPQVSTASYSGAVLTLNFNEALASSPILGDWSVSGGASSITSLSQSGTGNSTLSFTMSSITTNTTVQLAYTGTALTDTDGKALRYKNIWVAGGTDDTLDASAVSNGVALFGNGGRDTLTGGAGSDKLVGGQGNDTLTGGAGADIFAFVKGELSQDTVTDFSKMQGDKLDLSLLLDGAGMDKTSLSSVNKYLQLSQSGNDALLKISVTGSGEFAFADQTMTLTNAWSSGGLNDDIMTLLNNRVILA